MRSVSTGFLIEWAAGKVADGIFGQLQTMIEEMVGRLAASVGTAWVSVGVPVLSSEPGAKTPGRSIEGVADTFPVLDWVAWGGAVLAILAVVCLAIMMMVNAHRGESMLAVGRMGLVLAGVGLIGAAGLIARLAVGRGPRGVSGAAAFIQSNTWGWLLTFVTLSVLVGAIRIIIDQRMEPIRDLLRSLLTLVAITAVGATVVAMLVEATDRFSTAILSRSLDCDASDSTCFGSSVVSLLQVVSPPGTPAMGTMLVILLGLLAALVSLLQIVLLIARGAMLVVLTGVLPLTAAFTNTGMGRTWFNRTIGWLIALILYKPVAAIIYATAFQLVGDGALTRANDGLLTLATGLVLMVLALIALPALMRFVTPGVGAVLAAGGGGAAMGAGMAVAQGASMAAYRSRGGGHAQAGQGGRDGASGEAGPTGASGAAGGAGNSGAASQGAAGAAGTGTQGAAGGAGTAGAATTGATGAAGSAGAAGASAAGGAGASGSAGAAGAGAAPATGGASLAVAAGAQAAMQVSQAVAKGASDQVENTADGATS
ncbi:MAG: hypothetical protein ACK5IM_06540 [Demequina sp.]|uniref:hypothetical protein n=1 Tax=Demequina sp. TaxID=2050685 RepID=UPI003A89F782